MDSLSFVNAYVCRESRFRDAKVDSSIPSSAPVSPALWPVSRLAFLPSGLHVATTQANPGKSVSCNEPGLPGGTLERPALQQMLTDKLLNNRTLIGEVKSRDQWHTGVHEPIVAADLGDTAHALPCWSTSTPFGTCFCSTFAAIWFRGWWGVSPWVRTR